MNLYSFADKAAPALHVQNLQLLQAFSNYKTFLQIQRAVPGVFAGTENFVYFPSNNVQPATAYICDGTTMLILMLGVDSLDLATGFVNSWNLPATETAPNGNNQFLYSIAYNVNSYLGPQPQGGFSQVRFLGYSLGGGAANVWWNSFGNLSGALPNTVASYGAPRSVRVRFSPGNRAPNMVRIFGSDDVVANLPPWSSESPSSHLFVVRSYSQGMDTQEQPWNGVAIDNGGNTAAAYSIPVAISPFQGALPQWVFGTGVEGSNPHSLATYLGRWVTALNAVPIIEPTIPARFLPGPQNVGVAEQRAATRAAVEAASALGVANPAQQIANSTQNLVLVPRIRFTRYTSRGIRYIAYGEEIVAVAATKRAQKKLCREYNVWLRQNPGFMG
jgi:hypothetical protein